MSVFEHARVAHILYGPKHQEGLAILRILSCLQVSECLFSATVDAVRPGFSNMKTRMGAKYYQR